LTTSSFILGMNKKHRRQKSPARSKSKLPSAKSKSRSPSQIQDLAETFSQQLKNLPLDTLARTSGFRRRKPKKLTPALFAQAACLFVTLSAASFRSWAGLIGWLGGCTLTKQALWERCTDRAAKFLQAILQSLLVSVALQHGLGSPDALVFFGRVLLQDSTTLAVSKALARFFPGARNQRGAQGGLLKIQACYDLLTQQFVHFSLSSFRRNDQAAAADVLPLLRAGDLVIRDLGYFVLEVLEQIAQAQAYFLSRFRVGVGLWETDGRTPVNLLALLRRQGCLDRQFCCGDRKVPVRLVAVRLPAAVAAERRRLARQNRDRRSPPSAERLALLDWAIFITNVPRTVWSARTVAQMYGLRWRIEILFKAWKSHFALAEVPAGSKAQVESFIYAKLIFITLFQVCFARWLPETQTEERPALSLLKVAQAIRDYLLILVVRRQGTDVAGAWQQLLHTHCRYERRRRRHFLQDAQWCGYALSKGTLA
jgi:hypothetical protein